MKYLTEYRSAAYTQRLARLIAKHVTRPWTLMEVCGGQTYSIVKNGIDELLPEAITLVHGPGCPVCVTPLECIDRALAIAARPGVIFCSFGDMLRVPGSRQDLLSVKAGGGDVRIVYSPLDAVRIARENPTREVVFFAVGFETTAPANAMAVYQAAQEKLANFSVLVSQVLVPPAIEAILAAPDNQVQGFLAAGHVCAIHGYDAYDEIAARHRVPIVVTGFEPIDIMQGIFLCIKQLEAHEARVENQYSRAVKRLGNATAIHLINSIFTVCDRKWRGIGLIPHSGLRLHQDFSAFDAEARFGVGDIEVQEPEVCIAGEVLRGRKKPVDCPAFGTLCTPDSPLGATMVSSEGACAAYYRYRRADGGSRV